jgi:hypothetical protein
MEAFLIFDDHTTSTEDLLTGKVTLWNTIIGGGDANGKSSNATKVIVTVSGSNGANQKLRLRAKNESKKVVFVKEQPISEIQNEPTKYEFNISHTGCEVLNLTAEIVGAKKPERKEGTIQYQCGE